MSSGPIDRARSRGRRDPRSGIRAPAAAAEPWTRAVSPRSLTRPWPSSSSGRTARGRATCRTAALAGGSTPCTAGARSRAYARCAGRILCTRCGPGSTCCRTRRPSVFVGDRLRGRRPGEGVDPLPNGVEALIGLRTPDLPRRYAAHRSGKAGNSERFHASPPLEPPHSVALAHNKWQSPRGFLRREDPDRTRS